MIKKTHEDSAFLRGLLAAGVSSLALGIGAPALAQDDQVDEIEEFDDLDDVATDDTIVVTGSRIAKDVFSSSSPIQVILPDQSSLAGLLSATEILQSTTAASGSFQLGDFASGFVFDGGPGANSLSLRGLGATRTLLLLNGRRLNPSGTRGTVSTVDLNVLPTAIVKRIDILKDGASSIYGSDAVAGVVNIITTDDFDGVTIDAATQLPTDGGGEVYRGSITAGLTGDRGHMVSSFEYFKREPVLQGQRDWARCPFENYRDPDTGERLDLLDTNPDTIDGPNGEKCFASANRYVVVVAPTRRVVFDPGNGDDPADPDWRIASLAERNFFDDEELGATLISPVERFTFSSFGSYDIDWFGGTTLFYEAMVNNRRSTSNSGTRQFAPQYSGAHPLNPFTDALFALPLTFVDPLEFDVELWTTRFVAGANGVVGDTGWTWDSAFVYGRSMGRYGSQIILEDRVGNALDIVETSPGVFDCAVNVNALPFGEPDVGPTCVPLDAFAAIRRGDARYTQAELDYITAFEYGNTTFEQILFQTSFANSAVFSLPAGDVGMAIGFEGRKDSIDDRPGPNAAAGNSWGLTSAGRTEGSDNVLEGFAEVYIPLLRDEPFFEHLNLEGSGRYTNYDSGYSGWTYKAGIDWGVGEGVKIRSSYGTSFRAPALFELFLGGQTAFFSGTDPCDDYGIDEPPGSPRFVNCASEGLPPDFASSSTPRVITFGNDTGRLTAETSRAITAGIIYQPTFVEDLSLAVDFFDIRVDDQVARFGAAAIFAACYDDPLFRTPGTLCDFVSGRDANGNVVEINDSYFNINLQHTQGFDFTVRYSRDFGLANMILDWRGTWTLVDEDELFDTGGVGAGRRDLNGTLGDPEFVFEGDVRFERGPWTLFYGIDFISSQEDYTFNGLTRDGTIFDLDVPNYMTHAVTLRYDVDDTFQLQAGVQNLTNEEPDPVSDVLNRVGTASLSAASQQDLIGRRIFLSVKKTF